MSIRKRLASFILLMTVLLVLMGGVLLVGAPFFVSAFGQSLKAMETLNVVRELKSNLTRQRASLNRYLLVDDEQELTAFEESSRLAKQNLENMKTRYATQIPSWYPEIETLFNTVSVAAGEVTRSYKKGNKSRALDLAGSSLLPNFQRLFDRVNTLENEKAVEAQAMFEKINDLSRHMESIVFVALLIATLFGILLFRALYRAVMNPLEVLKNGAEEFGKGHWDHRINLSSGNEFGALASSFNTMAENVKQLQLQAIHMDRMSAVGQLAGGVAHEINNPLTAVLGQAQILLAKLSPTDSLRAPISKIEQAALRCKKIVRGLLDFSRPTQSNFEDTDANSLVSSTLDLCEADLKKARINVEKRMAKTLPRIEANPSELQQVLLNLINNSIQAMPRGGTLILETRAHNEPLTMSERRKGAVPRSLQGQWVEIRIKDSGVGIAQEHLSRIFEPFFTTKEIGKGTGLGLAVSMGIVQKHSGDLRVESAGLNKGATFTLTLPVRKTLASQMFERRQGLAA